MIEHYSIELHGRCQRCTKPVYGFARPGHTTLLSYVCDLSPNEAAFTCVTCLSPREAEEIERANGSKVLSAVRKLNAEARAREPS